MSETEQILNFVARLPPTPNPYYATANKVGQVLRPPKSPLWSRRFRVVIWVLYIIIFFQAVFLVYQRVRVRMSARLQYNKLGLLVINISDSSAIAYFLHAPLSIYVISVNIALDRGYNVDMAPMICVYGHKFIPIVLGSWALLWVSACHCAQIFWESNMAHKMNRDKLKVAIKLGLTVFFVICAFGPLPFISWFFFKSYKYLHHLETGAHAMASKLRARGRNYDPATFNTLELLTLLLPGQKLTSDIERLKKALIIGTTIYFYVIIVLLAIYIPLLTISLRALYKQSLSQVNVDAGNGSHERSKPSRVGRKILRERQRLVYHAICVFISTAVHLPPTAWKIVHSTGDYLHNATWKEVTHIGLVAPLAFSANLILLILNIHSHQFLSDRKKKMQRAAMGSMAMTEEAPTRRRGIRTLFLSHTEDEEISLPDVAARTIINDEKTNLASEKLDYADPTTSKIEITQWTFSTVT